MAKMNQRTRQRYGLAANYLDTIQQELNTASEQARRAESDQRAIEAGNLGPGEVRVSKLDYHRRNQRTALAHAASKAESLRLLLEGAAERLNRP